MKIVGHAYLIALWLIIYTWYNINKCHSINPGLEIINGFKRGFISAHILKAVCIKYSQFQVMIFKFTLQNIYVLCKFLDHKTESFNLRNGNFKMLKH